MFGSNGVCVPVNDNCATFNTNGVCTSCYKGYQLANGNCQLSQQTGPIDPGCRRWDWDNQICLECSTRWYFSANRTCVRVDDNCQTFSSNGTCTSCYYGYILNGNSCQIQNLLCKTTNSNGTCTSCYSGYVLYNGQCTEISKLASLEQYYASCCPEKL